MKVLKIENRAFRVVVSVVVVAAAVVVGMVITYHLGRFVLANSPAYECGRGRGWGVGACTTDGIIVMGLIADLMVFVVGVCLCGLGHLTYRIERFFAP